jgi:hypothetical protein
MIFCSAFMKRLLSAFVCAMLVGLTATPSSQAADQVVTQAVPLVAGWNAVWLEVEPTDEDGLQLGPEEVFNNPAIESIASPRPLSGTSEFFADAPGSIESFNEEGWEFWNRADAPDANNLTLIFGNRPYLIKVAAGTAPFGVQVTGKVRFFRPTWNQDRYNLVGFGLEGTRSFSQFFQPSGGRHPLTKIFKLNPNGNWVPINGTETIVSRQAYWVFSNGPSNYMGPVAVDFELSRTGRLDYGGPGTLQKVGPGVPPLELQLAELIFTNLGTTAAEPSMDLLSVTSGVGGLSLFVVNPSTTALAFLRGNQVDSVVGGGSPSLGKQFVGGTTGILTLGAQRNWTSGQVVRRNVYRLRTSAIGASFYLPVSASLTRLEYTDSPTLEVSPEQRVGLWVGDVIVDASTSIVEDGAPVRPSASKVPARMILHFNGSAVRLLSQVTVMQTKTADPAVKPVQVLVVDPARIPFFEGIKERNGKRVGVRIEAVTYDMPRRMDAVSQSAILNDPAYPGLTAAGLPAFLVSRTVRPPSLREVYALSLTLTGTVAPGATISTAAGSLNLDPFHRSNPFRHAYHQQHSGGAAISRDLRIDFDPEQPVGDTLRGTYSETIRGLINSNLTLTGRVELRRISSVASLDGAP